MNSTETQPPIPQELLSAVFALNDSRRLALGYRLIDSVEDAPSDTYPDWPEGWEEELERRMLEVERGQATISHEEVMAPLEEGFRLTSEARSNRVQTKS